MRSTSFGAEPAPHERGTLGATAVEFLGVSVLVTIALLTLVQMAVWVWARGVVVSAAHEGARTAAEAGRPLDDGVTKARSLLADGLGGGARRFNVEAEQRGTVVAVRARGDAPVILPFLPRFTITAAASAYDEDAVLP